MLLALLILISVTSEDLEENQSVETHFPFL